MTTPTVGLTHDLVGYFNNSISVGIIIKPYSYRYNQAPTFLPRLGATDPRGVDLARWKSFIQSRFEGGSNQGVWSGSSANNRYYVSRRVDIRPEAQNAYVSYSEYDPAHGGRLKLDCYPQYTTSGSPGSPSLMSAGKDALAFPMVMYSTRPHIFQVLGNFLYTTVAEPSAWETYRLEYKTEKLTGKWAVQSTWAGEAYTLNVVNFSGVIVRPIRDSGLYIYGSTDTGGTLPATTYKPSYSTFATRVQVYDDKIWRSYQGQISYLNPAVNTLDAIWSDELAVGDKGDDVLGLEVFNGKLYIGKRDALWVYDAGTIYRVESFPELADDYNFSLFVAYQGYLYFSMRHKLYRLSTGGTIENIALPEVEGSIVSGDAADDQVLIGFRLYNDGNPYTTFYLFDIETGGVRQWMNSNDDASPYPAEPYFVKSLGGLTWLAQQEIDPLYHSTAFPVRAVNFVDQQGGVDDLSNMGVGYLVTSQLDFGFPSVPKLYNKVIITYKLTDGNNESIRVQYETPEWFGGGVPHVLGTITDDTVHTAEFSFPADTTGKSIQLMFYLFSDGIITPELYSYEIEYAFAPSDLHMVDFVALAVNNMELLQPGVRENSAEFVTATLLSMAASPKSFVFGLPWPSVGQTMRALVSITQPGGYVPGVSPSGGGPGEGEIPIHLDEV